MNRFSDELMDVPVIIIKRIRAESSKIILKLLKMLIEHFYCYKIHSVNQFMGISGQSCDAPNICQIKTSVRPRIQIFINFGKGVIK